MYNFGRVQNHFGVLKEPVTSFLAFLVKMWDSLTSSKGEFYFWVQIKTKVNFSFKLNWVLILIGPVSKPEIPKSRSLMDSHGSECGWCETCIQSQPERFLAPFFEWSQFFLKLRKNSQESLTFWMPSQEVHAHVLWEPYSFYRLQSNKYGYFEGETCKKCEFLGRFWGPNSGFIMASFEWKNRLVVFILCFFGLYETAFIDQIKIIFQKSVILCLCWIKWSDPYWQNRHSAETGTWGL